MSDRDDAVPRTPGAGSVQEWLEDYLAAHGGVAGTVHEQRGTDLHLLAACNIPPPVLEVVRLVPYGKGMAGEAQIRKAPVQTCNLQTDTSGHVNPMARLVGGQAAVALPLLTPTGDVRAVVGIAFAYEGEIPAEEEARLQAAAESLPLA